MPPNRSPLALLEAGRAVSRDLQQEIEQFLFYEAAVQDERLLDEWFALLSEDVRYVMPLRATRAAEFSGPHDIAYFDDTKASMTLRLRKLQTSSAWAEEPPSRTRHFVNNVRITPLPAGGEYEVACAFMVYRNRAERQTDLFAGERIDGLRRTGGPAGFEIFSRTILIDQATLAANNISFFF
jgi:3-phenylpropionate/cinnamic acid dioxygenase small subunit